MFFFVLNVFISIQLVTTLRVEYTINDLDQQYFFHLKCHIKKTLNLREKDGYKKVSDSGFA